MATDKQCRKIEEALLALAAEKPFVDIRLTEIAAQAEIDLADLRKAFDTPVAILESFARHIDVGVLEGDDPSMDGEPRRERLFEVVMRRFDLLAPHRAALAGLEKAARRDPLLACHLARIAVGSQAWMLEAAGISTGGVVGRLRAPALALALARLLPTFLADTEEGLPKTMAALDETLAGLQRIDTRVKWAADLVCRVRDYRRPEAGAAGATDVEAADPSI